MAIVESEILTRLVLAAILGACVGVERKIHKKPAGLRTHALICMGAALFTMISGEFEDDPIRLASGIVTGIGFLAAGVIFRAENKIEGITTASELWVIAATGIAVGAGYFYMAIVTTVLVLLLLAPGFVLERDVEEFVEKNKKKIEQKKKYKYTD